VQAEAEPAIRTRPQPQCILCGGSGAPLYRGLCDRLEGVPGEWSHRRCTAPACGLVWLDPMPLPEELGRLYASYFTHRSRAEADEFAGDLKRRELAALARHFGYAEARARADSLLARLHGLSPWVRERAGRAVLWQPATARGRVLDVGCGNGTFLCRMRGLGWEVAGVDFDPEAVRVAREVHGLDARCGSLDSAGFEPASFDLVALIHVLEHLPEPRAALAAAARLLRPGGTLALVTPNFASLDSRIHRSDWRPLEPPRHLFLFSPVSVRRCVEELDDAFSRVDVMACAATARSTWGRSRLLRRERRRHGMRSGSPDERGYAWYKKVEGRVFNLVEHVLNLFAPLGEELVLFARCA
jgi:2-polyprenyl-3-methyl-5-hydroxy-6-metoxy-1,4-benzoquinol methylase